MVLLVEKLCHSLKLCSKLENGHRHRHRHRQSEAVSASLRAFRCDISNCLNQLSSNSKSESEFLYLLWIQQCLELLSYVNKSFAKLVMIIDYPMSKWEVPSMEEYLSYSLKLLELLNSITSSLSHLGQARLSVSHALSLIKSSPPSAIERLKAVQFKNLNKDFKMEDMEESKERLCSGKEWVVHQALMTMKTNSYWVCRIVLSGLSGDIKPYLEMKKSASECLNSSLMALDLKFSEAIMVKQGVLKEVEDVNEAAACLAEATKIGRSDDGAEQLERKLEVMQKLLDVVGKEADGLFSELMAGRNELLDSLRQRMQ